MSNLVWLHNHDHPQIFVTNFDELQHLLKNLMVAQPVKKSLKSFFSLGFQILCLRFQTYF